MGSNNFIVFLVACLFINVCAAKETNFIVGGTDAKENEFPYQVSMRFRNQHFCGGSLIDSCWVLTAAHCLEVVPLSERTNITVVAGTTKRNNPGEQQSAVAKFKKHKNFKRGVLFVDDIGLVKLKTCFRFTNKTQAVSLSSDYIGANQSVIATGWGFTNKDATVRTNDLKKIVETTITNDKCKNPFKAKIPKEDICTMPRQNEGLCPGDSGGPVVIENAPGLKSQIGLVSGGVPCAIGYSDIQMRISSYIKWIEDNKK